MECPSVIKNILGVFMKAYKSNKLSFAVATLLSASAFSNPVLSQDNASAELEEVVVTGSRISAPGMVSTSPITSISEETIDFFQEPQVEKILRTLPGVIPGDGSNTNNGSAGAATVNLRGLGPQRTLVLLDGKRMVPFNINGQVDVSTIPSSLIERVDVVTGGASAVYGSDAITGAINFILKDDFEGLEISTTFNETGEGDGDTDNVSLIFGSSFADDKGHMVMAMDYYKREQILLGQRPLGLLGIDTESGANYEQFLAGEAPLAAPAGCGGPDVVAAGGSTTAIPTRFAIVGGGAGTSGQFRDDGTISDTCSVFNFNPYNFYQTPQERYNFFASGDLELNDNTKVYGSVNYTNTTVDAQVAPSGTFGATFNLPLRNPLIGDQARQFMIDAGNTALGNGLLATTGPAANWQDINANGVVDEEDYLKVQLRRRTVELGARSEQFDAGLWQMNFGVQGNFGKLLPEWDYDVSFQYGESNRTGIRDGYTNLTNIQNALDSFDGVTCNNGDSTCVPINLFGGFGTITSEMAGYARAIALYTESYEQTVFTAVADGPVNFAQSPFAESPLLLSVGLEHRDESASFNPDECLKLAPASCQGGAGGNQLPVSGGYMVDEFFIEGLLPLVSNAPFAESLALEFGYRTSDYDVVSDRANTWKLGLNWSPMSSLMVRVMQQEAIRAPNVGELASPVVTGLANATGDPCSVGNAANITPELAALCISTGMVAAQVGTVQDVISGQVSIISGSDLTSPPDVETAETFTAGFVWTPETDLLINPTISVDYYDIEIEDTIGNFSAQEILDACYDAGLQSECAKIRRIGGDLTISGAGIESFTTNLKSARAEGIEASFNFGISLGDMGDLNFNGILNHYLKNESQSSEFSRVIDCNGHYSTSCDPLAETRWVQRTTWNKDAYSVSLQWRHIGETSIEPVERDAVFPAFRSIDAQDYFDLFASYTMNDTYTFSASVDNLLDEEPPVVGNEAGDTSSNSGNTFPSLYDTLGRVYRVGFTARF